MRQRRLLLLVLLLLLLLLLLLKLLLGLLLHERLVLLVRVATGCCAVPTRQEGCQDERDQEREARSDHRCHVDPRRWCTGSYSENTSAATVVCVGLQQAATGCNMALKSGRVGS